MNYLTNTVINYKKVTIDNKEIEDYTSIYFGNMKKYVSECDGDFFDWHFSVDDDKMERISYELYGSEHYWDILVLINSRDPLFDMPYNGDTVLSMSEDKTEEYRSGVFKNSFTTEHTAYMTEEYNKIISERNESFRALRIVKPNKFQEFMKEAYAVGCFK
jgi:hypothetical protein